MLRCVFRPSLPSIMGPIRRGAWAHANVQNARLPLMPREDSLRVVDEAIAELEAEVANPRAADGHDPISMGGIAKPACIH